jgi:hypothetical protein
MHGSTNIKLLISSTCEYPKNPAQLSKSVARTLHFPLTSYHLGSNVFINSLLKISRFPNYKFHVAGFSLRRQQLFLSLFSRNDTDGCKDM